MGYWHALGSLLGYNDFTWEPIPHGGLEFPIKTQLSTLECISLLCANEKFTVK